MKTYLFDACAAVDIYLPRDNRVKKAIQFIINQKKLHNQATLFIPNICIAEVFNAFAKKRFEPEDSSEQLDNDAYARCLGRFRNDVHWGNLLYPYDVNRYHIIAADKVIPIEHNLASIIRRSHLSTFDILIIAMACELAYIGQRGETYLVTCDRRLKEVFDELKKVDPSEFMIPGPLGEVDKARWLPPNCLYLPAIKRGELEPVSGPHPLNL